MPNYTIQTKQMTANDYIKLGGAAILTVAAAFGVYKLVKFMKKRSETRDYNKEVNKKNLTHTDSEFVTMADRIDGALNTFFDDDEQTVYDILSQLANRDEWNKLISVFGVRRRTWARGQVNGTLIDWFQDAFNKNELAKVKQILSNIGVTF